MASQQDKTVEQDWSEIEELFARGDNAFVDRLRRFHNADILGAFAARWFADRRPEARQMLRDYLSRPLNAYRLEALVKRLFKMAEAANDDELMAYFLVLFDRSLRRVKPKKYHWESRSVEDRATAQALLNQWESARVETSGISQWNDRFYVYGRWSEEVIVLSEWGSVSGPAQSGRAARRVVTVPPLPPKRPVCYLVDVDVKKLIGVEIDVASYDLPFPDGLEA